VIKKPGLLFSQLSINVVSVRSNSAMNTKSFLRRQRDERQINSCDDKEAESLMADWPLL